MVAKLMPSLFSIDKVPGRRNVFLVHGEIYIYKARRREVWGCLYKGRDNAEFVASRMTANVIDQAEDENVRFDQARAYLASRHARPAPSQLTLF